MGAIAVTIDWTKAVDADSATRMMSDVPHRSAAGMRVSSSEHAVLAEGRARTSDPHWKLATLGPLTIVGDIRLWRQGDLQAAAGATATEGLNDRELILAAYQRSGWQAMMDAIDGDFAFVIWDDHARLLFAARDRFGVIPLFLCNTPTSLLLATEPKQLVDTSHPPILDDASIAAHLRGKPTAPRHTFFADVERVLPGEAIIATDRSLARSRYWHPTPQDMAIEPADVPGLYRDHLVDAVQHRTQTSSMTICQLSGGLDSTTIAASAAVLTGEGLDPGRFATVSAVFPGRPADESVWIDEIVASQPFAHHDFVPGIADLDTFAEDMWHADRPWANPIRDLEVASASYGNDVGADLMLSGRAGDDLVDDDSLLPDLLRSGSPRRWWSGARASSAQYGFPTGSVAVATAGEALPQPVKTAINRIMSTNGPDGDNSLTSAELRSLVTAPIEPPQSDASAFPTRTQRAVIENMHRPNLTQTNEFEEAQLARFGIATSQPHLDRDLVEFVASIPIRSRPFDGRTKPLARSAFRGLLPDNVIDRKSKTFANEYIAEAFTALAPAFIDRFPKPTEPSQRYIDTERYEKAMRQARSGHLTLDLYRQLWPAWTLMLWLDLLPRYG